MNPHLQSTGITKQQLWWLFWLLLAAAVVWLFLAVWPDWLKGILLSKKAFVSAIFNGITLAGLYFLVASGFTLVFGLMRNVNLAHGSLYLFGAYIGYEVTDRTGNWLLGVVAGFLLLMIVGLLMQVLVFRRLEGDDLRQTLVSLGISIVAADLMLWLWTGTTYQILTPEWLDGSLESPIISTMRSNGSVVYIRFPLYRIVVLLAAIAIGIGLWLALNKSRIGMMIRAGVDDREMLSANGINVHVVFALVFAVGAGLAGFAGVVGGSALSVAPGEDIRYLLASLVVVIVGGMGSITGAAIGALLIGLAEQISLVYFPTYGVVLTFVIMVVTLAIRPQGIMGVARPAAARYYRETETAAAAEDPYDALTDTQQPWWSRIGVWPISLVALLLIYPVIASDFFVFQIGAYSIILGILGLSLMLLAGYGGMVSLAQITVAGIAGYTIAIFGTNSVAEHGFGWSWWVLVPFAILVASLSAALIGAIAARTEGIYTIMITLAIATAMTSFANQNYTLFNGHSGFAGIQPPTLFGVYLRDPWPFYYLCLGSGLLAYAAVLYSSRSTFGLALQAIRDNPRRMQALGYAVNVHKVTAYFLAGAIAGIAGVLLVWFNGRISPGTISVDAAVNILIIAIIGGMRAPSGPFIGALLFVLLSTFAIDLVGVARFNTLIGLVFLMIVFYSPDGILGLWGKCKPLFAQRSLRMGLARPAGSAESGRV